MAFLPTPDPTPQQGRTPVTSQNNNGLGRAFQPARHQKVLRDNITAALSKYTCLSLTEILRS